MLECRDGNGSKLASNNAIIGLPSSLNGSAGLFPPLVALHNMAEMKLAGTNHHLLPAAAALCRALGPVGPRPPFMTPNGYTQNLTASYSTGSAHALSATPHGISDILSRPGIYAGVMPVSMSSVTRSDAPTAYSVPRKPVDLQAQAPLYWSAVLQNAAAWRTVTGIFNLYKYFLMNVHILNSISKYIDQHLRLYMYIQMNINIYSYNTCTRKHEPTCICVIHHV